MEFFFVFIKGFFTSAGLIIAIGAQNAFVLTQGLRKNYPTAIALTCATIDAILIVAGVLGMGVLIKSSPVFLYFATLGGALFITAYGCRALYNAFHAKGLKASAEKPGSLGLAIATCMALSLLNPHVYLDTVILLGAIGGSLPNHQQLAFTIGACLASLVWFMSLSHGARYLGPVLSHARAWQILDGIIAGMMFLIAASLWGQLDHSLIFSEQ